MHCADPETRHILNEETLPYLKDGVFIVNTSRGALLETDKVIKFLKTGKIGYLAIDVYEEEADYFYSDLSDKVPTNDELARLLTFPTCWSPHMAFLTDHALRNIAETTWVTSPSLNARAVRQRGQRVTAARCRRPPRPRYCPKYRRRM